MKLPLLALSVLSLAAVTVSAAHTEPSVSRVNMSGFPISSVVVVHGVGGVDMAYASGAIAPAVAGSPIKGDTKAQTIGAIGRLAETLKAQGFGLSDVVMMRVFLVGDRHLGGKMDFAGMMSGYSQFFGSADQTNKPARTTVQVAALAAPGALVEIEAQAVRLHQ